MIAPGIHDHQIGDPIEVFLDPRHIMIFDARGRAIRQGAETMTGATAPAVNIRAG